jgi:hypothetical protein
MAFRAALLFGRLCLRKTLSLIRGDWKPQNVVIFLPTFPFLHKFIFLNLTELLALCRKQSWRYFWKVARHPQGQINLVEKANYTRKKEDNSRRWHRMCATGLQNAINRIANGPAEAP